MTALFAGLLAGAVFAQDTPPADPPKPPDEPAKPEPIPAVEWNASWQAARNVAQKRQGYALMWVQADKVNGQDAPHTSRINDMYFGRPDVFGPLNEQFGCWKGSFADAQREGGKHLQDAGVKEGPAVIFVNPENGDVVDAYIGKFTYQEIGEVTNAVMAGDSRLKVEERLKEKENKDNPKLNLLYGNALLRTGEAAEARKHFEISGKSTDMKEKIMSDVGIAWCDLKEKKYKAAIEQAEKAMAQMPPMIDPRGTCLYIQVYAYHEMGNAADCAKVAGTLRETLVRTTHGWKLMDDIVDGGYCFICQKKFTPATAHTCEPTEPK